MSIQSYIITGFILFSGTTGAYSQVLDKHSVEPFDQLVVEGNATVFISQSNEESISINREGTGVPGYRVENDRLLVTGQTDGKVYVKFKTLRAIEVNGNANVYASDTLFIPNINIKVSGNGDAGLLLRSDELDVQVEGASDIRLDGIVRRLKGMISGAGDMRAYGLYVEDADLELQGAGDAQVNVAGRLKALVSGAGTLYHQGTPKEMDVKVSGAGKVKKSNSITGTGPGDTTRIKLGSKKIIILEEDKDSKVEIGDDVIVEGREKEHTQRGHKYRKHKIWEGLEMGHTSYLNTNNTWEMDSANAAFTLNHGKSFSYRLNINERHLHLIRENLFFSTGLGIEFNNYFFNRGTVITNPGGSKAVAVTDTSVSYRKSKLITTFLNIPLHLTIATNPFKNGKRLSISPGVIAGWNFRSYQRRIIDLPGGKLKIRNHEDINLNPFQVKASLRLVYGNFVLFGNYSFTPLFKKNEGPELIPFSAGFGFTFSDD